MPPPMKQILETMCGGDFMNKNLDEAFQFLDYVVEVSRSWEEPIFKEPLIRAHLVSQLIHVQLVLLD